MYRLEVRKALECKLTPLIIPVASIFAEDFGTNVSIPYPLPPLNEEVFGQQLFSPELSLDVITEGYVSKISNSENPGQCVAIEILMSSARIHVLHNFPILAEDGLVSLGPAFPSSEYCQHDLNSTIDIIFNRCHLIWAGAIRDSSHANLSISLHGFSLGLCISSGLQPSQQDRGPEINVFTLSIGQSQCKFTQGRLDVTCDSISTELNHMGPEIMVVTCLNLAEAQRELLEVYKKYTIDASVSTGNMIYRILRSSSNKAVVDPFTTIHPSYLVQTGRPHQLRTDSTFKLLFHLRDCLWHLDDFERRHFFSLDNYTGSIVDEDALSLLKIRLASLGMDVNSSKVLDIATLCTSFPRLQNPDNPQRPTVRGRFPHSVSVQSQTIQLSVRDPQGCSSTRFTLTELTIAAHLRPMEFIPFSFHSQATLSHASLHNFERPKVQQLIASVTVADINLTVSPHLMPFAQQVLRAHRHYRHSCDPKQHIVTEAIAAPNIVGTMAIHVTSSLGHLQIQAGAENLVFELKASGTRTASTLLDSQNHSVLLDEVFFRARSPSDFTKQNEQDVLASLTFTKVKANAVMRSPTAIVRTLLSAENLLFKVPRSALRLYRFIEEWRADFLPGIEATLQAFLSEVRQAPVNPLSPTPHSLYFAPILQIHGSVTSFGIALQVMHGTWLSWDVYRTVMYFRSSITPTGTSDFQYFGLQLASQSFDISSKLGVSADIAPSTRIKLKFPTLSLAGRRGESCIQTITLVDFFYVKVKPSYWDTLLVVQQKFGQDFNDLMSLVEETRRRPQTSSTKKPTSSGNIWGHSGSLKMRGFCIGLEGLSSRIFLDCKDIHGGIDQDAARIWHIQLSDLGLSLVPRATITSRDFATDRSNCLAFVIIDCQTRAGSDFFRTSSGNALSVSVTKIHAVMQPSSVGEIVDFLDQMQVGAFLQLLTFSVNNSASSVKSLRGNSKESSNLPHLKRRRRVSCAHLGSTSRIRRPKLMELG